MSKATSMPAWATTIREKYLAGEAATFVLYRNVFDVFLVDGELRDLKDFLTNKFAPDSKPTVIEISPEFGAHVLKKGSNDIDLSAGGDLLPKLHLLESSLRTTKGIMLYVPYADTLMPGDDAGYVSAEDRKVATVFHRWSLDRQMNGMDNITFIVVESLGSLNQGLLNNPKVAAIEIPMPDQATRLGLVNKLAPTLSANLASMYATRMAGMRSVQIESLMKTSDGTGMAVEERERLILGLLTGTPDAEARAKQFAGITAGMTPEEIVKLVEPTKSLPEQTPDEAVLRLIQARKRELIEKECAGLIEFVEPKHGLSAVGGIDHIKGELNEIAKNLREGNTRLSPMGLLAVGPMGAGKTFVLKAFLKEAGLSAVALKNFRSKWVGSTERNLERVLATVKAMGPIAVLIDEGDRSFGSGGGEGGDDGTSSRVIARLKEFMSDTDNRGNVLFILLTNRPDKLDTDIKRPGRLDRKVPFFYAENGADRSEIVKVLIKRYALTGDVEDEALIALCERLNGYSNADLEALVLLAVEYHDREPTLALIEALAKAAEDFMPPQEREMIDFMELLAVSETSRRSLLPDRFKRMPLEDIQKALRIARLQALGR
ncbi:AAA family ATPase [Roseateles sp.]|uniref:ATP-binding protein n=1 Tax=Roseateles sp. TaxID=1971397 RepID=UPI003267D665